MPTETNTPLVDRDAIIARLVTFFRESRGEVSNETICDQVIIPIINEVAAAQKAQP